jgi:hypothetical protein
MKHNRYLLGLALLVVGTMPAFSQVSSDNEDEVYKIDARAGRNDFVPGQVLVKFKDESPVNVRRVAGQFKSVDKKTVDNVLREFGVVTMEKLFPNAKPLQTRRRAKAFNGQMIEEKDLSQIYLVKTKSLRKDSTMQLVDKLKTLDEVEYAEPNYKVYIMGQAPSSPAPHQYYQQRARTITYTTETTDDVICADPSKNPLYSQQWGLEYEGLPELWTKPIINRKRPVIAILDTGVDITHPDLVDNIWTNMREVEGEIDYDNDGNGFISDVHGWDFINNTADIRDYNSHGTHVAGIAAACNNETGIIGANPQALIMPVTVMQSDGTGDAATIAQGVDYAVENGATILNMSFGSYANSKTLRRSLEYAYQSAVLVAAAGNDSRGIYYTCDIYHPAQLYPAAFEFVLGTQAIEPSGSFASFSNYDCDGPTFSIPGVDMYSVDEGSVNYEMAYPGVGIISTIPEGNYKQLNGTSMAAPLLAGAISALQMVKEYDTQEILWGDIVHSANIAKAYNITERPAMLEVVTLKWDDSTDGGNGDGQPDAGEILRLYPIIKTSWGEAKNIKLNLSVAEFDDASLVDIQNKDVDFGGNLSSYAKGMCKNPFIIKIADDVSNLRHIRLRLAMRCDESQQDVSYEFSIVVSNIVKIGGLIGSDITLTADKNYLVSANLGIPEGVTLTIEPGTTLRFANNTSLSSQGNLIIQGTPQKPIVLTSMNADEYWGSIISSNPIEYCIIENSTTKGDLELRNCIISNCKASLVSGILNTPGKLYNCNYVNSFDTYFVWTPELIGVNIINNYFFTYLNNLPRIDSFEKVNYFNLTNAATFQQFLFAAHKKSGSDPNPNPTLTKPETTAYMGTSREDIANTYILDIDYDFGFEQVDLTNLRKAPYSEAHGIVWKVVVNGKDAQDEYDELDPLGVGKHKFEVYFNRPMNKDKIPQISFGVREPYTQNAVAEDGEDSGWNEEGTIYTVYKTITGKTMSDGVNRIYVRGAEDNEYFECPYEKTRFNVMINAAGSMATGFAGEAKMGRVELTWNNENNDFEDAMGFNIYRFSDSKLKTIPAHYDENNNWIEETQVPDTICINKEIVDIETTEYTDYDVTPGETYYYMYKVLSTDLKEYDVSNVVAVTPLTSELGDANGSGEVDVNDVVTTVNYVVGEQPKPFIFEAADMNKDLSIDVLDVIGIVQKVLNPAAARAMAVAEETAVYTVEDGVLYIETPVTLGGLQIQASLMNNERMNSEQFAAAADMKGFEIASGWLTESDYRMLAYSFGSKVLEPGKHAILTIGDANLTSLRLSDPLGNRVNVVAGEATAVKDAMGSKVMNTKGVWNLNGQKVSGNDTNLRKGVYIINGEKVIK